MFDAAVEVDSHPNSRYVNQQLFVPLEQLFVFATNDVLAPEVATDDALTQLISLIDHKQHIPQPVWFRMLIQVIYQHLHILLFPNAVAVFFEAVESCMTIHECIHVHHHGFL